MKEFTLIIVIVIFWVLVFNFFSINNKFLELKYYQYVNQKELIQKIDRLQNTIDSLKQLK